MSATARFHWISLALILICLPASAAPKWPAIDPADLAATTPQIDPEAGAEILFREISYDHRRGSRLFKEVHLRVKIFDTRGIEKFSKISITYDNDYQLDGLEVRTISPDGTITSLTPKDYYTRDTVKFGREISRETSFAPANLQPGAIVEYRYYTSTHRWGYQIPLLFQDNVPILISRFNVAPIAGACVRSMSFNMPPQDMNMRTDGSFRFELKNLPAYKAEPFQPPELHSQRALLFCYCADEPLPPREYWEREGKMLHEGFKLSAGSSRVLKATVAQITDADDSEQQKLQKIYDFCRTKIINLDRGTQQYTREQRRDLKESDTASKTLKLGYGTSTDINLLFAALASAAGCDARIAHVNDRSFITFQYDATESIMLSDLIVAVRKTNRWHFFDPGATYIPFAMLRPENSGTASLPAAAEKADIVTTRSEPAESSQEWITGDLQFDADGSLRGTFRWTFSGYLDAQMKYSFDSLSPTEREEIVRNKIQDTLKAATITDLEITHAADPTAPLEIRGHLHIPGYADRAGSRLFFSPAVFHKQKPPLFRENERRHDVVFPFAWKENCELRIRPPDGHEFEEAVAPGSIDLGDMGSYTTAVNLNKTTQEIAYRRTFIQRARTLPQNQYPAILAAFALMHQHDNHVMTLKRK
jgi:hypothetical protein